MDIYQELVERDLIAQTTNEEKVKDILKNKKVPFYIGFEPTADSLHVGHFVQIMIMSRLQKAGHIPIILFGGATALIGDPSGKTDMRRMMTQEEINHNIECFKKQASKFIDFSPGKAYIVNNAYWLLDLNYIKFLREIGVYFSVNRMLAAECYKQRLDHGLTFFELNYMIMQSYDFLVLSRKYNCFLELGGDDQWSNIIGGVELIRKCDQKEAYGLTFALLTTSEGKKMGKTEKGALWLDENKTSPYDFFQYWRNVNDSDVIKCLKMLTFLPVEEIKKYEKLEGQELNEVKELLAFEITKLVHGEEKAKKTLETARSLFSNKNNQADMPTYTIDKTYVNTQDIEISDVLKQSGLVASKSDGRRLIEQGGVTVDGQKISDVCFKISVKDLEKGVVIKKGKKTYKKILLK